MSYRVEFSVESIKTLDKLDRRDSATIVEGIYRFAETGTPRPKALTGMFKGLSRLRFGDWRVLIRLRGDLAIIVYIGRRDKVYKR